jgi:hypothetical protein
MVFVKFIYGLNLLAKKTFFVFHVKAPDKTIAPFGARERGYFFRFLNQFTMPLNIADPIAVAPIII